MRCIGRTSRRKLIKILLVVLILLILLRLNNIGEIHESTDIEFAVKFSNVDAKSMSNLNKDTHKRIPDEEFSEQLQITKQTITAVNLRMNSTVKHIVPSMMENHNQSKEYLEKFLSSSEITKHGRDLEWIVSKIRQEMNQWLTAQTLGRRNGVLKDTPRKRILIFMGLLDINMGKDAFGGGPVGELVQWGSIIVGLHLLQHYIEIVANRGQFEQKMIEGDHYDLIITDYLGLSRMNEYRYFQNQCKLRILDSFGTDPEFNIRTFGSIKGNGFEKWYLPDTRQIWTYYPLTVDNSFLGAMVPMKPKATPRNSKSINEKPKAVIYGKSSSYLTYLTGTVSVLKLLSEYMTIHLTMIEEGNFVDLPFPYTNHGVLSQNDLSELLSNTHLFVGLGFPFLGPGPFDALAHGCAYLQPTFKQPKNRDTDTFFTGKPTMLTLNSQHSYLEKFGNAEYVYTVDYEDIEQVRAVVEKISNSEKLPPYIPYELTGVGFLERLSILIEKLNICSVGNLAIGIVPTLGNAHSKDSNANGITSVTDGEWSMDSCYSLERRSSDRPYIELAFENSIWISEIKLKLKPTWVNVQHGYPPQIEIELRSTEGVPLGNRLFSVDRVSFEWLWVNADSVSSVRVYTDTSIRICEVEVYSNEKYEELWPSLDNLQVILSRPGEACSTTCYTQDLICARNLFPMLDSIDYLRSHSECSEFKTDIVGPGIMNSVSHPEEQTCFLNGDPILYSCAAHRESVLRICPCVVKHSGQNGLPLAG